MDADKFKFKALTEAIIQVAFTVHDKVILELKAVSHILPAHEVQLVNYLKATSLEVGLIINFAGERVEVRRKILTRL